MDYACVICHQEAEDNEERLPNPCKNCRKQGIFYHKTCMVNWLKSQYENLRSRTSTEDTIDIINGCPICRKHISIPSKPRTDLLYEYFHETEDAHLKGWKWVRIACLFYIAFGDRLWNLSFWHACIFLFLLCQVYINRDGMWEDICSVMNVWKRLLWETPYVIIAIHVHLWISYFVTVTTLVIVMGDDIACFTRFFIHSFLLCMTSVTLSLALSMGLHRRTFLFIWGGPMIVMLFVELCNFMGSFVPITLLDIPKTGTRGSCDDIYLETNTTWANNVLIGLALVSISVVISFVYLLCTKQASQRWGMSRLSVEPDFERAFTDTM